MQGQVVGRLQLANGRNHVDGIIRLYKAMTILLLETTKYFPQDVMFGYMNLSSTSKVLNPCVDNAYLTASVMDWT